MDYERIYNNIIHKRINDPYIGYTETHHILPKCLGGTDDKINLVNLNAKEHFICHLLLTKIYPIGSNSYYKMCHAFMMMLVGNKSQPRYITSKIYVSLKEGHSIRMSDLQRGIGNSQYGTKWMHNKNLMQCKKVPKDTILDDDWEDGRICNWNEYFSKVNKRIINENIRNEKAAEKAAELNNIDWNFTYSIYLLYGYEITCFLTGYTKSRETLLALFKKRVDDYTPSRSIKKIKSENIVR